MAVRPANAERNSLAVFISHLYFLDGRREISFNAIVFDKHDEVSMLAIKATCDGKKVILPTRRKFPRGPVIIVFEETVDEDRFLWQQLSLQGLARTYGDKEPDYSLNLVKEPNVEYKP